MLKGKTVTLRQRKFLEYYLITGNASQSALKAGFKDEHYAYEILQNPIFQTAFQQLLDKEGITDEYLIRKLKQGLEAKKIIRIK